MRIINIYIKKRKEKKKKKSILNINPIKAGVGLNLIPIKKKNKQTNKQTLGSNDFKSK